MHLRSNPVDKKALSSTFGVVMLHVITGIIDHGVDPKLFSDEEINKAVTTPPKEFF